MREGTGAKNEEDGGKKGIRGARKEQSITGRDGWFDIILAEAATCGPEYFY